jgi:hypothetical protein
MSLTVLDGGAVRVNNPESSAFADLIAAVDVTVIEVLGGREPVWYQPAIGDPVEVWGIFDAQYILVGEGERAGVETVGPAVFLRLAELPVDPEVDDPILGIGGLDYRVTERRTAGLGSTLLMLRLVG